MKYIIKYIEEEIKLDECNKEMLEKFPDLHWTTKKEAKENVDYLTKLIEFKKRYLKKYE